MIDKILDELRSKSVAGAGDRHVTLADAIAAVRSAVAGTFDESTPTHATAELEAASVGGKSKAHQGRYTSANEKVTVRIAVAVDPSGDWNSSGWGSASDTQKMDLAVETVGSGERRYWLTAELEVPKIQDVPAAITPADEPY